MFIYDDPSINTVYDNGTVTRPTLDVFLQNSNGKPLGAVVIMPGGGYSHLAEHEGSLIAAHFNRMGFHAFVLKYRVSPNRFPAPQQDVLRAIRIIRANAKEWEVDPDKIAIGGFSAGGHLSASCGTKWRDIPFEKVDEIDNQSSEPNAMILCYPVIDICSDFAHKGSGNFLFGTEEMIPEKYELCCQNCVDENTPPAFVWHTATDPVVPASTSVNFANAMWKCGNTCELHIFPKGLHGRGLGLGHKDIHRWPELAAEFLETTAGFIRA